MKKIFDWEHSAPLHQMPLARESQDPDLLDLEELIEMAAQMLPAEGPITGFAFLNPLHAFEHLPFAEAVKIGLRLFGGQPYLSEAQYREEVVRERIRPIDLKTVLEEDLGEGSKASVSGLCSRLDLRLAMLHNPILMGTDPELHWYMAETEALTHFRAGVPLQVRNQLFADSFRWVMRDLINQGAPDGGFKLPTEDDPRRKHLLWPLLKRFDFAKIDRWSEETKDAFTLHALWRVCQENVRTVELLDKSTWRKVRPRDALFEATGIDSDVLVHEFLVRFCAAFVDQGYAHWSIPNAPMGLYQSFLKLYSASGGPPNRWLHGLGAELARLIAADIGPLASIHESLALLGIDKEEWVEFFPATMLALRGWSSMIRQMDVRSERFPVHAPKRNLLEYMAVRLILERYAVAYVAKAELHFDGPLQEVRCEALAKTPPQTKASIDQRTFLVFQLAQVMAWTPNALDRLSKDQWHTLIEEIETFSSLERRRLFHLAFERRYRIKALDALGVHTQRTPKRVENPLFQVSFCIDAREESFRRHLEETCPNVETFAAAGFYSIPMFYRGVADAHFNALCPIVVQPMHYMTEESVYSLHETERRRAKNRRMVGTASLNFEAGSRTFALGALLSGGLGMLASIPLVARVMFPRLTASISKTASSMFEPPPVTRLVLERTAPTPGPEEDHIGFTLAEMANFGERVLRDIGLTNGFARLMFFLGHKTSCLNNPHKSAYDCGACTGPGGPNARALAVMLNDPRVRDILGQRGLNIPHDTFFLGGSHNTGIDAVVVFDLDLLPKSHLKDYEAARAVFEKACALNAHERCRRFYSAPLDISLEGALRHVENRTEDLAQVRPEFGNASNAMCITSRRSRTRGMYMDRRCFMHSYDPLQDPDGAILARILSAVIPVCQGINLQYYFSCIDPARWGSGSKLPHNVTSLVGVMDGAASDLRQGLPWQGVEIHEPLRCLFVNETTPAIMLKIMDENNTIGRIIRNGWAQLAVLSPTSNEIQIFKDHAFHVYHPETTTLPHVARSADWYRGCRTHLDFAEIG